jgi:hypothetical protein
MLFELFYLTIETATFAYGYTAYPVLNCRCAWRKIWYDIDKGASKGALLKRDSCEGFLLADDNLIHI